MLPMYEPPATVRIAHAPFNALDGYPLSGTLYSHSGDESVRTVAVFACGGGIPASRYRHFAAWLAEHNIPVLTFDYRGIGGSRPQDLRRLSAGVADWSENDVGGAIAKLRETYPAQEIIGISHSIGALMFGGAPNVSAISRFVFVCPHTGYVGDYLPRYRVPMALIWHFVMPALTRAIGYFPGKVLGLGEDLPAGVALGWASRKTADLAASAADTRALRLLDHARQLEGNALIVTVPGDVFATSSGVARLLKQYPRLVTTSAPVTSADDGATGHFAFFKPGAELIWWPSVHRWMSNQSDKIEPSRP
jgi:predicted alpha/beta hydrolase